MKFGSLFSGIGGMDKGLEDSGMGCVFQVESNEFCQYVLKKMYPDTEIYGDIKEWIKTLTFSAGDSPALPLVMRPVQQENSRKMKDGSGLSSFKQFASLPQNGYWLKMSQAFSLPGMEDYLGEYSETWPQSGMMQNGVVFELPPWDFPTTEKDFSLLPTPMASDWRRTPFSLKSAVKSILNGSTTSLVFVLRKLGVHISVFPQIYCAVMGFPLEILKSSNGFKPSGTQSFPRLRKLSGES